MLNFSSDVIGELTTAYSHFLAFLFTDYLFGTARGVYTSSAWTFVYRMSTAHSAAMEVAFFYLAMRERKSRYVVPHFAQIKDCVKKNLQYPHRSGKVSEMICTERIHMQSHSEALAVELEPQERQRLHAAMVLAGVALKKLRLKKLSRDSHQRRYGRWGHIDRLKAKDFRNSPRGKEYYRQYQSERRKKPHWHFRNWLYGDINRSIRRQKASRSGRTEALIGCTIAELMTHLEAQFTNGFSWSNRSSWQIDHIVPVSAFDLSSPEEQRIAFNYRNLRPLDPRENQTKSDTLPDPLPSWLPAHIADRIRTRRPERRTV